MNNKFILSAVILLFLLFNFLSFFTPLDSKEILPAWSRTYGSSDNDWGVSIQQTSDNDFIILGTTNSYGTGDTDLWVLKLNPNGSTIWQKVYSDPEYDSASSIQQTSDKGYIISGWTKSPLSADANILVQKLNNDGTVAWRKIYGGNNDDTAFSIQQTSDKGFIIAGYTESFGAGWSDFLVMKLNFDGSIAWQKSYGDAGWQQAYSILQTSDGGFVVAGENKPFATGNYDIWILKLNFDGSIVWQRSYGGFSDDKVNFIQQTKDGGYIAAGSTTSYGRGSDDFWLLKIKPDGSIDWQKTYGGKETEIPSNIQQTKDGGYIVLGETISSKKERSHDFWIIKLNKNGSIKWQKTFGGDKDETAKIIQQITDDNYIIIGSTLTFGAGNSDIWVLKISSDGKLPPFGVNTNITPYDTFIITSDTAIKPSDASLTSSDKPIIFKDTTATVKQQWPGKEGIK